jgi:hypothetical protein
MRINPVRHLPMRAGAIMVVSTGCCFRPCDPKTCGATDPVYTSMNTDVAAQRAIDRLNRHGFDALSEPEKIVATVWLTEAALGNSGFARYFASKRGDVAFYAPTALKMMGATQLADIAAEANALCRPNGPARDLKTRRAQAAAFDPAVRQRLRVLEDRFYACAEDVDELLEKFVNSGGEQARPANSWMGP